MEDILALLIHALPIACIAWTVTHEEISREFNDYCSDRSKSCHWFVQRKFFYLFTCEYCFSFWVTAALLLATGFKLYYTDWRGYLLAFFSLPWVANVYMSIYQRLRVDLRRGKAEADQEEIEAKRLKK